MRPMLEGSKPIPGRIFGGSKSMFKRLLEGSRPTLRRLCWGGYALWVVFRHPCGAIVLRRRWNDGTMCVLNPNTGPIKIFPNMGFELSSIHHSMGFEPSSRHGTIWTTAKCQSDHHDWTTHILEQFNPNKIFLQNIFFCYWSILLVGFRLASGWLWARKWLQVHMNMGMQIL